MVRRTITEEEDGKRLETFDLGFTSVTYVTDPSDYQPSPDPEPE